MLWRKPGHTGRVLVGETDVASGRSWRGLRAFPLSLSTTPLIKRDMALT